MFLEVTIDLPNVSTAEMSPNYIPFYVQMASLTYTSYITSASYDSQKAYLNYLYRPILRNRPVFTYIFYAF